MSGGRPPPLRLLVLLAGLTLAGCATVQEQQERTLDKAADWGNRTLVILYRSYGPVIAYFGAATGDGGPLYMWDEKRTDLLVGKWFMRDGGRQLCFNPNPYYREMLVTVQVEWESCVEPYGSLFDRWHYRGDVYRLAGRTTVPFVTSKDPEVNARIAEQRDHASEYARTFMGDLKWQPPRKSGPPPVLAAPPGL
jgi:hypothetical protein